MAQSADPTATANESKVNLALGLAIVALVLYVVAMIVAQEEDNGWLWPVAGLTGGAGAVVGWMAGKPRPRGKALAAVILGGLIFIAILAWTVVALITGDL